MSEAPYRVVYRNGSGYKTRAVREYQLKGSGALVVEYPDGRRDVFSAASDWRIGDRPGAGDSGGVARAD